MSRESAASRVPMIASRAPHLGENGAMIYDHSIAVPYSYSEKIWGGLNAKIERRGINRANTQIVTLPLHKDATESFTESLKKKPIGPYAVGTHTASLWPDSDIDLKALNIDPRAESVYIVGSLLTSEDFNTARSIALYCKQIMGIPVVTMVCPSIGKARQDKNVDKEKKFKPVTLNIATEMIASAPFFDRMIVFEPHSSATQAFAAQARMPLLPISLWKPLTDHMMKTGIPLTTDEKISVIPTPENATGIRPDVGRNLAFTRIEQQTGIRGVAFDKTRIDGKNTSMKKLSKADQKFVKGRIGFGYDDEVSTMGTLEQILNHLQQYGLLAFAFMSAYGKLIPGTGPEDPGWEERIQHPLLTKMYMSNAREPVGDPKKSSKIEIVDVAPFMREIIEADIKGVDFWRNPHYSPYVLQEKKTEIL